MDAKALFLDLSGVLYEGDSVIDGAPEAVEAARDRGLELRFVTNTATKSHEAIESKLKQMGMDVREGELFTAPQAAKSYLQKHRLRPFCLIHREIQDEFEDLDQDSPNAVLLGDAREQLHYDSLNKAFRICHEGGPLIGIGLNRYFKDENGLNLDAGPFIRALEWAAETEAVVTGKPSRTFFEQVVGSTSCDAGSCLMVGDDAESDVVAAIEAGLQGCLVRTGKYQEADESKLPAAAAVVDSVAELMEQWESLETGE
ncbi:MAG: TIGR01458 family HAD-type hydrolase [Phycisphaeraceae bacterium]|nr:TIGR01458 family HAD-type hydrolase [Phycisphaeraceae bacterium]